MSTPTTPMALPSTIRGTEMVVMSISLPPTVSAYGSSRQVRLASRGQVYQLLYGVPLTLRVVLVRSSSTMMVFSEAPPARLQ
ncbi:hypothetical protein D3C81_1610040 [compost metagenome]